MASTSSSSTHGALGDERELQARMYEQQKQRGAEVSTSMPAPQHSMKTKPDCGETSYAGSGQLRDKVAFVTGGDSGIGRAVVIAFAREGADIALIYHTEDRDAEETQRYVTEAGRRCILIKCDVSVPDDCARAVEECVRRLGGVHCLVNNAGVQYQEDSIADVSPEQLDKVMKTNVHSCFYLTQAALKHMHERAGCTIIQTTSINAFTGNSSLLSYSTSKGAMQAFTRSMAKNLMEKGIRVNAVAPGPIWTPFITGTFDAERNASFGEHNPMKRAGQPVECAPAFVFLASAQSSYMTGHTLHVDGGQFMSD